MNRRRTLALTFVLLAITASGTHGATVMALDRSADIDIVGQDAGLLAVSQTTADFNSTQNTANLTVEITNQITVDIDRVDITADGATESTGTVSPGATDSVSFTDVDCVATVVIEYDTGSLSQRIERSVTCQ